MSDTSSTSVDVILNSAVQKCTSAYRQTFDAELKKGLGNHDATQKAAAAYRTAMPYLTAPNAVRAYIACVAHGMLLNIISNRDGSKLLYAAQVALGAMPREHRPVGRPKNPDPAKIIDPAPVPQNSGPLPEN